MIIGINKGKILSIENTLESEAIKTIDAQNSFVTPPFVDPHFHLDATLSFGNPRINQSGTLLEGIALWGELNPTQSVEDFEARALANFANGRLRAAYWRYAHMLTSATRDYSQYKLC